MQTLLREVASNLHCDFRVLALFEAWVDDHHAFVAADPNLQRRRHRVESTAVRHHTSASGDGARAVGAVEPVCTISGISSQVLPRYPVPTAPFPRLGEALAHARLHFPDDRRWKSPSSRRRITASAFRHSDGASVRMNQAEAFFSCVSVRQEEARPAIPSHPSDALPTTCLSFRGRCFTSRERKYEQVVADVGCASALAASFPARAGRGCPWTTRTAGRSRPGSRHPSPSTPRRRRCGC